MSTPQDQPELERIRIRLTRVDQQVQTDRRELLSYLGFRIRTAVGGLICLIVLFLPTLATWFSDHPGAGSAPADNLIDHWSFWLMLSEGLGGGDARLPDGDPAGGAIGGGERDLAWLVFLVLALTAVMLVRTAMDGRWPFALTTSIGAAVTLVAEFVLRFYGGSDDQGNPGWPHSYDVGAGLTLAQIAALAVTIWAASVMVIARRREPTA